MNERLITCGSLLLCVAAGAADAQPLGSNTAQLAAVIVAALSGVTFTVRGIIGR